jgi:hypothetical protein
MFYCPNCNNTYNIAKVSEQSGGVFGFPTTDSSSSENIMDGGDTSKLIETILSNPDINIKDVNTEQLIKSAEYKKLTIEEKEIVYNKIQDTIPKSTKKLVENKPSDAKNNLAFFVCNNCGYSVPIKEGTKIFSKASDEVSQKYGTSDYSNILYSNIVPRTRKYLCPNKKCESHTNPVKREAIFFRKNNAYDVVYICTACKTSF